MAEFVREDLSGSRFEHADLSGSEFRAVDLRGSRFHGVAMDGVVMRDVDLVGVDITGEIADLTINGVDVVPLVEAELDRRFPGRASRRATDPDGLRAAWAMLERSWSAPLDRVATMPPGTVDVSVAGEWSFAQTLRHLVLATDAWLGRGILGI